MNCTHFTDWLDRGRPDSGAGRARDHAAGCSACREALNDAIAVDRLFDVPPIPVTAAFTDRVMARVEAEPRHRPAVAPVLQPEPVWWLEAAAEPAAALALLAAGLLVWKWSVVVDGVGRGIDALSVALSSPAAVFAKPFTGLGGMTAETTLLSISGALLAWGSYRLFLSVERWISGSMTNTAGMRGAR